MMPESQSSSPKKRTGASIDLEARALSFQDTYLCPICRHGSITGLTLMDAFACDFCRHILTANLQEQTVQVVDTQPMTWRWNGRRWLSGTLQNGQFTGLIWLVGIAVVILPPTLIGLSAYTFPPLPGSRWAWFPVAWAWTTLVVHLLMVSWLIAEHYQFSPYITGKVWIRHWLRRQ
ncbi:MULTISPECIES: hypothetical protein [unclassified Leptolyngbya]|uniref:hypothetical protein n=1 Tax=unclassified Leptolyngbya TaxID=2650499 RepID=UPI001F550C1A|nr:MULTISPECIES: hypothetical protein [unclassified Leptolyngbya]